MRIKMFDWPSYRDNYLNVRRDEEVSIFEIGVNEFCAKNDVVSIFEIKNMLCVVYDRSKTE